MLFLMRTKTRRVPGSRRAAAITASATRAAERLSASASRLAVAISAQQKQLANALTFDFEHLALALVRIERRAPNFDLSNRFSPRVGTGVSGSSFRASRMHISSQASVRSAPIVLIDGGKPRKIGVRRNGDKLPHAFRSPHRLMGCRWRERHRALGWCRGRSSRDGDLRGRVPALAQGTNHLAPRLSSNRRQSPDSACVSATRTRRAFSFGGHGPMTSLESLGAFAAMIFIAALTVATAFPVTAQS